MQLGDPVRGLMMNLHWRFVVSDLFGVADQVRAYDPQGHVRLAGHDQTQQLAVVKFIEKRHLDDEIEDAVQAPVDDLGGAWLIVFHPKRGDGQDMIGDPDSTVLTQLRQRDARLRRDPVNEQKLLREMERVHEVREQAAALEILDKLRENTARRLHRLSRLDHMPWMPNRIFVPRGIKGSDHRRG